MERPRPSMGTIRGSAGDAVSRTRNQSCSPGPTAPVSSVCENRAGSRLESRPARIRAGPPTFIRAMTWTIRRGPGSRGRSWSLAAVPAFQSARYSSRATSIEKSRTTRSRARAPSAARCALGIPATRVIAAARSPDSAGLTMCPASPTTRAQSPTSVATGTSPVAIASSSAFGSPSVSELETTRSAARSSRAMSVRSPSPWTRSMSGSDLASACVPVPTSTSSSAGWVVRAASAAASSVAWSFCGWTRATVIATIASAPIPSSARTAALSSASARNRAVSQPFGSTIHRRGW